MTNIFRFVYGRRDWCPAMESDRSRSDGSPSCGIVSGAGDASDLMPQR
jgi:hypothetical protein